MTIVLFSIAALLAVAVLEFGAVLILLLRDEARRGKRRGVVDLGASRSRGTAPHIRRGRGA